jgi:ABC-type transport system involved in multi-copper enzyme maturation permease subunit
MAVYERRYGPYLGTKTARNQRFMVLPTYSYQELFKSKLFIVFLAIWGVYSLLVLSILLYLPHNAAVLKALSILPAEIIDSLKFDASFFFSWFMVPSMIVSYLTALVIGPALISADLRNNGLPLYLARPFGRWEYVLGKSASMLILLSFVTWIPGLFLYALQSYLSGWDWFKANASIGPAIFLTSAIWIVLLSMTSLAISAYVKWKPVARLCLILVFIIMPTIGNLVNFLIKTSWGSILDIRRMTAVIATTMFKIPNQSNVSTFVAWLSILGFSAFCIVLLSRKVRAYEVIKS